MSATVISFPGAAHSIVAPVAAAPISAGALACKFTDHFLPIVQASVDLLEADELDFESRCRQMLNPDGAEMIDELCDEIDIVSRQMAWNRNQAVASALERAS